MTKETKKIQLWLPLLLSCMMVAGMLIGVKIKPQTAPTKIIIENDSRSSDLGNGRLEELLRYIDARYVDKVDNDKLVEEAIESIINKLDPHSNYMTAEQVIEVNEQLQGTFRGIGVEFMMLDDTIVVLKPIKEGPSEEAGLLANDRIVAINDTIVAGVERDVNDIMKMLRGPIDTKVKIGVVRNNETKVHDYQVRRDDIAVHSVDIAQMLSNDVGYIKINRFSANTYSEFIKGVERLEKDSMQHLIIDVRQNQGGYLQEATKILSQLFPEKNKLLVYTEGRAVHRNEYESTGQNFFSIDKVAVLIDEGSASASEILAGAIQDWDRGPIIGRRSFGKGLVQEQYGLKDGSALRLTIARYYTPSGRSIQRNYDDLDSYNDDFYSRLDNGELTDITKISQDDSLVYQTVGGRKVYAGGGITPDIFVPIDTLEMNTYFKQLSFHLPKFAYRTYQKDFQNWQMPLDDFVHTYAISDSLVENFISYAVEKEVNRDADALTIIKTLLQNHLKARLAKHIYGDKGFFAILNHTDPVIQEALNSFELSNPLVDQPTIPSTKEEF